MSDEDKIRIVHKDYLEAWLEMNEEKLMALFEEDAMIQPNSLTPITGKTNLRKFWFPNDISTTTIHHFETEITHLQIQDTLATSIHNSKLDWSYQKDSTHMRMFQEGINTTIYRKQQDKSWKIWRSMWTDLSSKRIE